MQHWMLALSEAEERVREEADKSLALVAELQELKLAGKLCVMFMLTAQPRGVTWLRERRVRASRSTLGLRGFVSVWAGWGMLASTALSHCLKREPSQALCVKLSYA